MTEPSFLLSQFISIIIDRMQDADEGEVIEEIVEEVLDGNNWNSLILNEALDEEVKERIFDALVSSDKIVGILIVPTFVLEVSSMEPMLRKAIQTLTNLHTISMGLALTESEAERILSILRMSPTLKQIILFLGKCSDGIARPLAKYLRESATLTVLSLNWAPLLQETDLSTISQDGFASICKGIGECASLTSLVLDQPPTNNEEANVAARSIALAIAKSKSLLGAGVSRRYREFLGKVRASLALAPIVQNFDLCVHERENETDDVLVLFFCRDIPWKPLLSQNMPLSLWPHILCKANTWNHYVSHSPLDALFFLMKEKNDVLLQNVRRRKIRKRKRGQFYS
jgi:hypothetical protein